MKLIVAYAKLNALKLPVMTTNDAGACLAISRSHASQLLRRLSTANYIVRLKQGLWGFPERIEPLILPRYLTAPFPSYLSLQTALYYHDMIEQIPAVIYAVSLARTKRYDTPLGSVSIHHIAASCFFGFDIDQSTEIAMAIPEKALFDVCYLSTAKTRLFAALPELQLPKRFSQVKLTEMIKRIPSPQRQAIVKRKLRPFIK